MRPDEARSILGVDASATDSDVRRARRRLAGRLHPDVGGDAQRMALVNEAVRVLATSEPNDHVGPVRSTSAPEHEHATVDDTTLGVDRPSFVIDVLPAEAFEVLVLAARELGEIVDDDPPYLLDVHLTDHGFCRLEIVPDAGSSTVSVLTEPTTSAERIGALFVRTVNDLGPPPP